VPLFLSATRTRAQIGVKTILSS